MQESPSWKSISHSASQKISLLLWNPKAHYRGHKNPSLVPILSQMNPVHTFPPYFQKIQSNINLPSTKRDAQTTYKSLGLEAEEEEEEK